jgi:hypothetical protein
LNLGFQPYQPNEPGRRKKAGCGRILILESIFRSFDADIGSFFFAFLLLGCRTDWF